MKSWPEASRNGAGRVDALPPALSSMWRLCKLGYRHEPALMFSAFVLSQLGALPDALLALWLKLLGGGVLHHNAARVRLTAVALGVSAAGTWFLTTIHPALVLLAVFALPAVLASTWRPAVERLARERGAQANRLARHLFTIATTAPPGKEVRVTGIGERLITDRRAAWERWYGPVAAARWGTAAWNTLAWAVFGGAYVGAVVFVASGLGAPPADVLLVLAAGSRLSAYIGATVGEIGFLRGFWMDGSRRLAWLEDYA